MVRKAIGLVFYIVLYTTAFVTTVVFLLALFKGINNVIEGRNFFNDIIRSLQYSWRNLGVLFGGYTIGLVIFIRFGIFNSKQGNKLDE